VSPALAVEPVAFGATVPAALGVPLVERARPGAGRAVRTDPSCAAAGARAPSGTGPH
jgi:hypothetical protein